MALVIAGFFPLLGIVGAGLKNVISKEETGGGDAYARAGNAANETLSSIRAVAACGGEQAEVSRYAAFLKIAEMAGIKKGLMSGITLGALMMLIFCSYGVGLFAGANFIIIGRCCRCL